MSQEKLVNKFLSFLGTAKQPISLHFLNELIKAHQERIKWETLTKIIDWENGNEADNYFPSIEAYINRITTKGMGGTCWTHSIGFHWLLSNLGFDVHYMYMDPRHLCLRVNLEQPYYVDVGYCAPLFQAYPLYESFQVSNVRETFPYQVSNKEIHITRDPGPVKTLITEPIQLTSMKKQITKSNDWRTSPVLKKIQIFGYVDSVPTSINGNVLKQYFADKKIEHILSPSELTYWITKKFCIDKEIYERAIEIFNEKSSNSKSGTQ
ncbi:arylamine N-acetyltransferase [Bacillus cereus]|nr:arylamine N-acetyltransferase [Bacillus cereus]